MATYYCRVCWNDKGWRLPAGRAGNDSGYAGRARFGHEEWLFNFSWTVGGFHYAFLQPVNKVRDRRAGESLDLLLWTIDPNGHRLQVGTITDCKILTAEERFRALRDHKQKGWFRQMQRDVEIVGGQKDELEYDALFNVRFRTTDAFIFDPPVSFPKLPAILARSSRYLLMKAVEQEVRALAADRVREGTGDLPDELASIVRSTSSRSMPAEIDPQERRLQRRLMELLQEEFGKENVRREGGFGPAQCDLLVKDGRRKILIEIKAYAEARRAVREALGQILEYAYYYAMGSKESVSLVIVAPAPYNEPISNYMKLLQTRFALPIQYCSFTLEDSLPTILHKAH